MRLLASLSALLFAVTCAAHAAPITATLTTTASGTVGSTPFTNATLTITDTYDPSQIVNTGSLYYVYNSTPWTYTVSGLGSFIADDSGGSEEIYVTYSGAVGFFGTNSLISINDASLAGFDLSGPFGPVTASHSFNTFDPLVGGAYISYHGNAPITVTFAAAATPEPPSALLLLTGLAGLLAMLHRRTSIITSSL